MNTLNDLINKPVLITLKDWFYAPNGEQYRAVFGIFKGVQKTEYFLGVPKDRSHANWFFKVGSMSVPGCLFANLIETEEVNLGTALAQGDKEDTVRRLSHIYHAK